jgi:hypothetical protein
VFPSGYECNGGSFLPIRFLASGLNKKMEIIQTNDVFVHFIYLHQYPVKKTAAHWKFLKIVFRDLMKKLNPKWPPCH